MGNQVAPLQGGNTIPDLKPAAREWLRRSARKIDTERADFDFENPPQVSDAVRQRLEAFTEECRAALRPAEPEEVMEIAHRLLVSKPAQDMSEAEATVFWQNFREDVAGMPAWGLALACERWRQDPARKYFPTGGELKDIVAADLEERLECYAHAKAILAYEPPKVEPYMTPERLKEIKEEMARDAERRNAARSEPSEGAGV